MFCYNMVIYVIICYISRKFNFFIAFKSVVRYNAITTLADKVLLLTGETRIREKWRNFVRRGGHRPSATTDLKNFADADGQWPPLRVFLAYPGCHVGSNDKADEGKNRWLIVCLHVRSLRLNVSAMIDQDFCNPKGFICIRILLEKAQWVGLIVYKQWSSSIRS